jgi:SAM-dependent methyltransferase
MDDRSDLWGGADAYERYMGRWSRLVAPAFVEWLGVPHGSEWLDVGCGTGALSTAIIDRCEPIRVVGVDQTEQFLEVARSRIRDERFATKVASADSLSSREGEFHAAVSGLVLNFVADKARAVAEMVRVTRPGGRVGLYVWDYAGHMQVMRHFFDVATKLDPGASRFDDGVNAPVCRPGPLARLFQEAGLDDVEVTPLDVRAAFTDFDDYWTPFLGGTGSAPRYVATLSPSSLERLREALRERIPTGPDGEILLAVRAWAVRGVVPGRRDAGS